MLQRNSVIVPTRNRHREICSFLNSLRQQSSQPDEIIIIDSSDEPLIKDDLFSSMYTQQNFPESRLVYRQSGPGAAYQRNVGIKVATTDLLHFFDDDVLLEPDYLKEMNEAFLDSKYVAGMGTVLQANTQRTFNRALRILFMLQREAASGFFTFSGMPTHAYGNKHFQDIQAVGGCCMSFRRAVLKDELFDEKLGWYSYMEDCDLSYRVSRKGKVFYNPAARLDHRHSPLNRDKVVDNRAKYIRNYSYLFFKNFYSQNRLRIFGYFWSVIGLFVEAICGRNLGYIKGYMRGLYQYWFIGMKGK